MSYQIGKYLVMIDNTNQSTVHILGTKYAHKVPVENLIEEYIFNNYRKLKNILYKFDNYYTIDDLLDDEEVMQVIEHMPDQNLIPGFDIQGNENIRRFHHQQIISSFNSLYNTNIILEEIEAFP